MCLVFTFEDFINQLTFAMALAGFDQVSIFNANLYLTLAHLETTNRDQFSHHYVCFKKLSKNYLTYVVKLRKII